MPHLLDAPTLEVAARVRENILDALQELTDLAWQRRMWFGDGTGPEMSSYVEAACSLFASELDSEAWQEVRAAAGELHALIFRFDPW